MARKQSSFDYDELEPPIQDFLRKKESDINSLINQLGWKKLTDRYRIGENIMEVRRVLKENNKNCYNDWIKKHIPMKEPTLKEHVFCYTYTNKYLGGITALEANPKITYSVLVKLGEPKATEDIKRRFAERLKSGDGEGIGCDEVDEAIANEQLKTVPSNQIDDL